MADLYVLDYSAGWPAGLTYSYGGRLVTAVGTVRYIGTPGHAKNITKAELEYRLARGVPTAFVHEEGTGGWMLGGRDAGRRAAAADLRDWTVNLGQRQDAFPGAFLADDADTVVGQLPAIDDCLRGYAEVAGPGRGWVYGEFDVVEHCVGVSKTARLGWQTRAWSHGVTSDLACLVQELGYVYPDDVECDRSTVLRDYWGYWPYETGGILVTLTAAQEQEVLAAARQINSAVGYGQRDFQGTVEATLAAVERLVNQLNSKAGVLSNAITAARDVVLGAVAALPTDHLSDTERQQLAEAIAALLTAHGVQVDPAPLLDALAVRLSPKAA